MGSKAIQSAIASLGVGTLTSTGKLVLVNKPRANIYKFFTVPAAQNGGVQVEKYTTKYGVTFEKHTTQNGVVTWWRLLVVPTATPASS